MNLQTKIENAFAQIRSAVEAFAQRDRFRIDRCPRGNSGWELVGDHPDGGEVYLLLLHDDNLGLGIGSVWQVACPEMSMQYSHFRPVRACVSEPTAVVAALELERSALAAVRFGHWTHIRPLTDATTNMA